MSCCKTWLPLLIITYLATLIFTDENYYALLGVSKEASTRDIRRAFKKLALIMHPDKNLNDQDARDRFLKVSRMYEVLKDENLRMKYDKFGERGLEDSQRSSGYETYDFYRNDFGIYDDDQQIITLDGGEFDAAVNSGELWFVNFYSPHCPQCHDLAPTWRELAKEMDSVMRIGVVNCIDAEDLCRSKGVDTYPTILLFKAGTNAEKYFGDKSKESLTRFAMQFVKSKVTEFWQGNVFNEIEVAFASRIGWIISFCAETGDCLSSTTRQKLAGMLEGLANVGWIDCTKYPDLCANFDLTPGSTAYFSPSSTLKHRGGVLSLHSLEVKEIYAEVVRHLPDLEMLTMETFSGKVARHRWVVIFSFRQDDPVLHEYKKLRILLKDYHIQVGMVDCVTEAELCGSFHIQKPSITVFKGLGIEQFEIHHGGDILYKVASFAKDGTSSHVTTLRPGNFPSHEREPWLVNFFAPSCLPCLALLPELRKASIHLFGQVKFGTLDCTVHKELCDQYHVHAFPTMMMLNGSSITEYEGHHTAEGVLEFVEHLVNPVVVVLAPDSFKTLVKQRSASEAWLVDFYVPWCGPCQALLSEWRRMAWMLNGIIKVGTVDCHKHQSFCQRENVPAYPEIRLFLQNTSNPDQYQSYNKKSKDSHSLKVWALGSLPRASVDLTPEDLRRLVYGGMEHWVLDFHTPWCGPCHQLSPEFELLAHAMKGTVRAGRVDCQAYSQACERAGVKAFPTVRFYPYLGSNMGCPPPPHDSGTRVERILTAEMRVASPESCSRGCSGYLQTRKASSPKSRMNFRWSRPDTTSQKFSHFDTTHTASVLPPRVCFTRGQLLLGTDIVV